MVGRPLIVPTAPIPHIGRIDLAAKVIPMTITSAATGSNERCNEAKTISVNFDSHVFSLIAIKKAAYKYIDSFSADIILTNDEIRCLLNFTSPKSDESCARLTDDFKKVYGEDVELVMMFEKILLEIEDLRAEVKKNDPMD